MKNNIIKVEISFFKTIIDTQDLILSDKKLNYLIGKNGVGKSNILKAIYQYKNNDQDYSPVITRNKGDYKEKVTQINIYSNFDKSLHKFWNDNRGFYLSKEVLESFFNESNSTLEFPDLEDNKMFSHPYMKKMILDVNNIDLSTLEEEEELETISENDKDSLAEFKRIYSKLNALYRDESFITIQYYRNHNDLVSHKLSYNLKTDSKLSDDYIEEEDINENLTHIINFLSSIILKYKGRDIKELITSYLESYSSTLDEEDEDSTEEIDNLSSELEELCNESIKLFFDENFKDSFDFKLKVKFNDDKMLFKIEPKENYICDRSHISESSEGVKALLNHIIRIESIFNSQVKFNQKTIILLDEPEKNMYPSIQKDFVNYLEKSIKERTNVFFVITTHHTSMIPSFDFTLNLINRDVEGKTQLDKVFGECSENECEQINKTLVGPYIEKIINGNESFEDIIKKNINRTGSKSV